MTKKKVYLAGHITSDPETFEWRTRTYDDLQGVFEVISPLRNKYQEGIFDDPTYQASDGMAATHVNPNSIVARDYYDVMSSHIILVNLSQYSTRPSWGTIFELAWAFMKRMPVIAFGADEQMKLHPFIIATVTEFHDTRENAISSLLTYWV